MRFILPEAKQTSTLNRLQFITLVILLITKLWQSENWVTLTARWQLEFETLRRTQKPACRDL